MNRYLVFAGDNYYPAGGIMDCKLSFQTADENEAIEKTLSLQGCDWLQLVRLEGLDPVTPILVRHWVNQAGHMVHYLHQEQPVIEVQVLSQLPAHLVAGLKAAQAVLQEHTLPPDQDILSEALAQYAHDTAWSGWMKHMFGLGMLDSAGNWVMPKERYERWTRLMNTPYPDLTDKEQGPDRWQARNIIEVLFRLGILED